jgi:hypothetical protein
LHRIECCQVSANRAKSAGHSAIVISVHASVRFKAKALQDCHASRVERDGPVIVNRLAVTLIDSSSWQKLIQLSEPALVSGLATCAAMNRMRTAVGHVDEVVHSLRHYGCNTELIKSVEKLYR